MIYRLHPRPDTATLVSDQIQGLSIHAGASLEKAGLKKTPSGLFLVFCFVLWIFLRGLIFLYNFLKVNQYDIKSSISNK